VCNVTDYEMITMVFIHTFDLLLILFEKMITRVCRIIGGHVYIVGEHAAMSAVCCTTGRDSINASLDHRDAQAEN